MAGLCSSRYRCTVLGTKSGTEVQYWAVPGTCAFNCSGRGACVNQTVCTCDRGYTGSYCELLLDSSLSALGATPIPGTALPESVQTNVYLKVPRASLWFYAIAMQRPVRRWRRAVSAFAIATRCPVLIYSVWRCYQAEMSEIFRARYPAPDMGRAVAVR